jgi:hypothetical protein
MTGCLPGNWHGRLRHSQQYRDHRQTFDDHGANVPHETLESEWPPVSSWRHKGRTLTRRYENAQSVEFRATTEPALMYHESNIAKWFFLNRGPQPAAAGSSSQGWKQKPPRKLSAMTRLLWFRSNCAHG